MRYVISYTPAKYRCHDKIEMSLILSNAKCQPVNQFVNIVKTFFISNSEES